MVSPGAMDIALASRIPPRSANGRRRREALGHRLHLAQPDAGELGEVLGAGHGVGVRRRAGLREGPPGVSHLEPQGLDLQAVADPVGERGQEGTRRPARRCR